jgi:excisionase family DNA binding protein
MSNSNDRDILNIEEAAALLGVSIKTFNKVLHSEDMPARKIGREWKFSRRALVEWVGEGRSRDFYREQSNGEADGAAGVQPAAGGQTVDRRSRRTEGWGIELD